MSEQESLINNFLLENSADGALITNYFGEVILSINIDYNDSIAAMSSAILSMCDKFLNDLEKDSLKQMIVKTNNATIIFAKINESKALVVFGKSGINLGIFLRQAELLAKKLN